MDANWRQRLSVDPHICHGRVCIKGTRVMVSVIVDNVADGEPIEEIMKGYGVTRENVESAMRYAADLTRERIIPLGAS